MFCRTCIAVVFCLGAAQAAHAFTFDDITTWVGSGASEAALIVGFNDGVDPVVLAWGYRFDGTPTAWDALMKVVAADGNFYATVDSKATYGPALFGLGYDVDGDGFGISDGTTFDANGVSDLNVWDANTDAGSSAATSPVDDATANDAADHYREGWWSNGFWVHFESPNNPYNVGSWQGGLGAGSQDLADGAWIGLSFDPVFSFTDPPTNPVPEPATMTLLGVGGAALLRRRR